MKNVGAIRGAKTKFTLSLNMPPIISEMLIMGISD